MSINFSANQYENAFKTLKNWEVPKGFGVYPNRRDGFTQVVATDRGHLQTGVSRSRGSPWGSFVGTWDMPTKIPGNSISNSTARSELAIDKLQRMRTDGDIVLRGHLKKSRVPPPMKVKGDVDDYPITQTLADVKPPTPKSATGRLSGGGEPPAESRLRSGAMNPVPKSVDWPRPDGSRLGKPLTPLPATPVKPRSPQEVKPLTPVTFPMANGVYSQQQQACVPGSPEPELQNLHPLAASPEHVNWPMPN